MNDIMITGIGMITTLGTCPDEIWDKLNQAESERYNGDGEIPFTVHLPPAKLRRLNRYAKLAVGSALFAQADADIIINSDEAFRYGTIFTTGYGAMVANIDFGKSVADNEPNLCSPTLFAGTVPNSCVGQVCMQLGLKGPSTILVGGNILFYSKLLMQGSKADIIFAGAVEEYSEDLFASVNKNIYAKDIDIQEAAIVFTLEKDPGKEAYCKIGNSAVSGLNVYPLIAKADYELSKNIIAQTVKKCVAGNECAADAVISSANGGYFDETEFQAIKEVLPDAVIISNIKRYFGETMGSAFSLNIAVAALYLKHTEMKNIIAAGYDTIGNYHCIMLSK